MIVDFQFPTYFYDIVDCQFGNTDSIHSRNLCKMRATPASLSISSTGQSEEEIQFNPNLIIDFNESNQIQQAFATHPPTLDEIDAVIERSSGRLLQDLGLFVTIQPSELEALSERIFTITQNPTHLVSLLETLHRQSRNAISSNTEYKWSYLKEKYQCSLCNEVLAAPNLSGSCDHSFCGACLLNSKGCPIKKSCPICDVLTENFYFERQLSNHIRSLVTQSEDCKEKVDWFERYEQYMKYSQDIQESKDYNKIGLESSSFRLEDFLVENLPVIIFGTLLMIAVMRRK